MNATGTTQNRDIPVAGRPAFRALLAALFGIGLLSRLAPLGNQGGRLLQQFPTEDGYLMLTIARNLALGHGMSISDGTIATNGTQPLATLLWAACFALVDGAKPSGVALVLILETCLAVLAALALYRLGRRVLTARRDAEAIARLAAAAWFASSITVSHSMNGLETGLYSLVTLGVALCFVEADAEAAQPWRARRSIGAGVLLGAAFWTRNDAVFLILAACLLHVYVGFLRGGTAWRANFLRTLGFGSLSVLVAAPWLVHNYIHFGHLMPISGVSEGHGAALGSNLLRLPSVVLEYIFVIVPIPESIQNRPWIVLLASCGVLAWVALLAALWNLLHAVERRLMVLVGIFAICLACFYGLFFGAGYFMSRYGFPVSPFLALLSAGMALWLWNAWLAKLPCALRVGIGLAILGLVAGLNLRTYLRAIPHPHFQVVEWVEANVPQEIWVGAIQSGTLGFFHDRTLNLDGKVSPEALRARLATRIPEYVAESPIQFLADWGSAPSITEWVQYPAIGQHFEVMVHDPQKNLAVLARKGSPLTVRRPRAAEASTQP